MTSNPDGTIGPVGGVPEKAQAAGEYGAKTRHFWFHQVRRSTTIKHAKRGMKVIEVDDVEDALAQFQS